MNLRSTYCTPFLLAALSVVATGQQPRPLTTASVMGTYAVPSSDTDGCWLQTAPLAADSLRVQLRCSTPSPAHHIGVFDARVAFHGGTAIYETNKSGGRCRITMRFADSKAVVTQDGTDQSCGFGASVNVGGTYRRGSSARPAFDLVPVEGQRQAITIIDPRDTAAYSAAGREALDAVARCHAPACRPDIFRGPLVGEITVGLDSSRGVRTSNFHEFQWHSLPDTEPPPGGQAFQDSAWAATLTRWEREKPRRLLLIDGVARSFAYARANVSLSSVWGVDQASAKEAKKLSTDPAAANGAIVITTKAHAPPPPGSASTLAPHRPSSSRSPR